MKNIKGNLFKQDCDAFCITTNGFRKPSNGAAVMGKGCAAQAARAWPGLDQKLGNMIKRYGNRAMKLGAVDGKVLVAFPVKTTREECEPGKGNVVRHMQMRMKEGQMVPGWACVASPEIIIRSAHQLVAMADKFEWTNVVIPRMGCGAGELNWNEIEPMMQEILDDRFSAITF